MIKTGKLLCQIRDELWLVLETNIHDERTEEIHILRMNISKLPNSSIIQFLNSEFPH